MHHALSCFVEHCPHNFIATPRYFAAPIDLARLIPGAGSAQTPPRLTWIYGTGLAHRTGARWGRPTTGGGAGSTTGARTASRANKWAMQDNWRVDGGWPDL